MFALALIASDLAQGAFDLAEYQKVKRKEEKEVSTGTLQDAIEAIPDLIAIDDGKGIIVTCNDAFAKFLDMPAHDIKGKSIHELLGQYLQKFKLLNGQAVTSVEDIAQKLWAALTTDQTLNIVTNDERSLMIDCGYMRDGGQMLVARDVTQVTAAKVRLETAINAMPLGFAYYDNEEKLVACNEGYEDLIKRPKEWIAAQPVDKIVGAMLRHVKGAKNQSLEVRSSWLHRALDDISNRRSTSNVVQFDDNRWIEINTMPAHGTGIITVANDITERKILELDLEKNEAQLREILQGQPFPVLVISDEDSQILFASTAAISTFLGPNSDLPPGEARQLVNNQPEVIGPHFWSFRY